MKKTLEIVSNLFKKNKLRLEHRQIRDTEMVRKFKNLQAEDPKFLAQQSEV